MKSPAKKPNSTNRLPTMTRHTPAHTARSSTKEYKSHNQPHSQLERDPSRQFFWHHVTMCTMDRTSVPDGALPHRGAVPGHGWLAAETISFPKLPIDPPVARYWTQADSGSRATGGCRSGEQAPPESPRAHVRRHECQRYAGSASDRSTDLVPGCRPRDTEHRTRLCAGRTAAAAARLTAREPAAHGRPARTCCLTPRQKTAATQRSTHGMPTQHRPDAWPAACALRRRAVFAIHRTHSTHSHT